MAVVDKGENISPGMKLFIESWNGWICDKSKSDMNTSTAFQVKCNFPENKMDVLRMEGIITKIV